VSVGVLDTSKHKIPCSTSLVGRVPSQARSTVQADVPDLEACSALGASPEEALAEVERAKDAWLSAAREAGKPIPEPRYRPAIYAR